MTDSTTDNNSGNPVLNSIGGAIKGTFDWFQSLSLVRAGEHEAEKVAVTLAQKAQGIPGVQQHEAGMASAAGKLAVNYAQAHPDQMKAVVQTVVTNPMVQDGLRTVVNNASHDPQVQAVIADQAKKAGAAALSGVVQQVGSMFSGTGAALSGALAAAGVGGNLMAGASEPAGGNAPNSSAPAASSTAPATTVNSNNPHQDGSNNDNQNTGSSLGQWLSNALGGILKNPVVAIGLAIMAAIFGPIVDLIGKALGGLGDMFSNFGNSPDISGQQGNSGNIVTNTLHNLENTAHTVARTVGGALHGGGGAIVNWDHSTSSAIANLQNVTPAQLLNAQITQESGGKSNAVSNVGASGIAQFMPETAKSVLAEMGVNVSVEQARQLSFDPKIAMKMYNQYMGDLIKEFHGDRALALAAYNAGPGAVESMIAKFGDPTKGQISDAEFIKDMPQYGSAYQQTTDYVRNIASMAVKDAAAHPSTVALNGNPTSPANTPNMNNGQSSAKV